MGIFLLNIFTLLGKKCSNYGESRIHGMRDTHYIIFCHSQKKTIDYCFLGAVATQWKLLTKDYVMHVVHSMNYIIGYGVIVYVHLQVYKRFVF